MSDATRSGGAPRMQPGGDAAVRERERVRRACVPDASGVRFAPPAAMAALEVVPLYASDLPQTQNPGAARARLVTLAVTRDS